MLHGVTAMQHGGRTRVDFHPLRQGRSVWDKVKDLHRLPSCVCVHASEGVGAHAR